MYTHRSLLSATLPVLIVQLLVVIGFIGSMAGCRHHRAPDLPVWMGVNVDVEVQGE